jgi:hypothetical protein
MSNYTSLKATIDANIKANDNQEITGQILNSVLNEMVNSLGTGYQFKGVATTSTNPGTPDSKVFYVATPGTYQYFGNQTVPEASTGFFKWDSSWHLEVISTGVADGAITTQKIAGGAVTTQKMADGAITAQKVADGAIISQKIADGAVTSQKIAGGAVSQAALASALVEKLFATGYKYIGMASETTNPGTPNQQVFYIALPGNYPYFGNIVVSQGNIGLLKYDGGWTLDQITISDFLEVLQNGFFITDETLNVALKYDEQGFDVGKISPHFASLLQQSGILGLTNVVETTGTGFAIVDSLLNIGVLVDSTGVHAQNIVDYEIVNL